MENGRVRELVSQWDHAEPPPDGYLGAEQFQARLDASQAEHARARQARAARYDKDLAVARMRLLSAQATSGFMRHVLAGPPARHSRNGRSRS